MRVLDFDLLPSIDFGHSCISLSGEILEKMTPLKKSLTRVQNSLRFAWYSTQNEIAGCPEDGLPALRNGFFRAALTEFVSVEDILPLDLKSLGSNQKAYKLSDTKHPHLNLFRELRNHEVHLYHNEFSSFSQDMLLGNAINNFEKSHPVTITCWTLGNITFESFSKLNNAKQFEGNDIRKSIDWFNSAQNKFGVQELFLRTVNDYSLELINYYSL